MVYDKGPPQQRERCGRLLLAKAWCARAQRAQRAWRAWWARRQRRASAIAGGCWACRTPPWRCCATCGAARRAAAARSAGPGPDRTAAPTPPPSLAASTPRRPSLIDNKRTLEQKHVENIACGPGAYDKWEQSSVSSDECVCLRHHCGFHPFATLFL